MAPLFRLRPSRLPCLLVALAVLAAALGGCETNPILRGTGSERWQNIRVGVPF
jgi:hypothetical protein